MLKKLKKLQSINRGRISSILFRVRPYTLVQQKINTTTTNIKIINVKLRQATKHLKDIRHKAHELRHEYLTQCLRNAELVDYKTHAQVIKNATYNREIKGYPQIHLIAIKTNR